MGYHPLNLALAQLKDSLLYLLKRNRTQYRYPISKQSADSQKETQKTNMIYPLQKRPFLRESSTNAGSKDLKVKKATIKEFKQDFCLS